MRVPVTTIDFAGTALMPKAHGTAKVDFTPGGLKVEVHLEGLGCASQTDPAYLTYVLWAISASHGKPRNLGELMVKGGDSTVTAFTNLTTFVM